MSHIGYQKGRLPRRFSDLTDQQIQDFGSTLNIEEDVLASIGLNAGQIERAKKVKRWRKYWDIGYATGKVAKNEELYKSKDSAIQRTFVEKVTPSVEEIEQIIEWKAPKWFYEELKVDKIKSARRSV